MNPLAASGLGAVVGLGLFVLARALFRDQQLSLGELQRGLAGGAGFRTSPASSATVILASDRPAAPLGGARGGLGRLGVAVMDLLRVGDAARLHDQLRVLGRTVEQHAYEKMLGAVAGFAFPVLFGMLLALGGVGVSPLIILIVSLAASVAGFFYPDLPLSDRVEEHRRTFRHALGSYLDLVTILLAGGAGMESALEGAAEDGDGWPFMEIRNALRRAALTRTSPWEAFEELGIELGIGELQDLAASVALAGSQGARIKLSLMAKADAMRSAQAAELEMLAERQTEKMLVPLMLMALGLTLFVGYGAVQSITANNDNPSISNSDLSDSDLSDSDLSDSDLSDSDLSDNEEQP